MKVNFFIPKYMVDFKCVSSSCIDTCCAGWDINIDSNTYNKYINSTGASKKLLDGKFISNKYNHDFFNEGFMILKPENKCPFLNSGMLCDIHGNIGEDNLSITCKSYPRVFNIVDNIYEKSGLPSCYEICLKAFLNKDKMEFVELEENIDEKNIEIRRIIDSEAFEGTDNLLQYFWDIRIISINIMQLRNFTIEERLSKLKEFYTNIEVLYSLEDLDAIDSLIEDVSSENFDYSILKSSINFSEDIDFYNSLLDDNLLNNIKSVRLKDCVNEYKSGILKSNNIKKNNEFIKELDEYSFIFENYLVNQIFKDLIPFNKGCNFSNSINFLINTYRVIKAYIIGISLNSTQHITAEDIVRVIQSLSKDIEHNKVFKDILERK